MCPFPGKPEGKRPEGDDRMAFGLQSRAKFSRRASRSSERPYPDAILYLAISGRRDTRRETVLRNFPKIRGTIATAALKEHTDSVTMRIISALPFIFALTPLALRAETPAAPAKTEPAKSAEAENLKKLIAAYPLTTCVISGEKLVDGGEMGDVVNYVHKEPGKPDRLVRLCCKGCLKDFKKDPAKYLKIIDDAAAKTPKKSA